MDTDLRLVGYWWRPNDAKTKVPGTLQRDAEGKLNLDLLGTFSGVDLHSFNEPSTRSCDVLLGISEDGKLVTLVDCLGGNQVYRTQGVLTESFHPHIVILGKHFKNKDAIKFDEMVIRLTHLDEWVFLHGFSLEISQKPFHVKASYKHPGRIKLFSDTESSLYVDFVANFKPPFPVVRQLRIDQEAQLVLRRKTDRRLESYQDQSWHIANFVSLGLLSPVKFTKLFGAVRGQDRKKKLVEIIYEQHDIPVSKKPIHPHDSLFCLPDIRQQTQRMFDNWFQKRGNLKPILDLYFSMIHAEFAYSEQRFLAIVQALESYHRRTRTGLELPPEQHKARIDAIVAGVPQEHKNWLKSRLGYSNEIGMKKRLTELRNDTAAHTAIILTDQHLKQAYDTRNYLTHYDPSLTSKAATGFELVKLTERLNMLMEICLLKELGIDDQGITELIAGSDRFQRRVRWVTRT